MKTTTCAMVLIDKDGNILACHGTGKPADTGYDFPKGCVDEDETHFEAACREMKEETGLTLESLYKNNLIAVAQQLDGGIHKHNNHKDIHLFLCPLKEFPKIESLECTSFFTAPNGKEFPEMNGYKIISKEERNLFNKVLWDKFPIIDKINSMVDYGN